MITRLRAQNRPIHKLFSIVIAGLFIFQNNALAIATVFTSTETLAPVTQTESIRDEFAGRYLAEVREHSHHPSLSQRTPFEEMLSSKENLLRYIRSGRILKLVPEWGEWVALYENENYRKYHPITPEQHILTIFERMESDYFMQITQREGFSEEDIRTIRCVLFLHDFGEICVLKDDPSYSYAFHVKHPVKSAEIARNILLRLGYAQEQIETKLLLIKYHSFLGNLARFASLHTGKEPVKSVMALKNVHSLRMLRYIQLVDAGSVRIRFRDSLSSGLEKRVNALTELASGILSDDEKDRESNTADFLDYLYDISRQTMMINSEMNELKTILSKKGININNKLLEEAFYAMHRSHLGQKRKDRYTPYVIHCIDTAIILINELGVTDPDLIIAALLHDVLEDTETSKDALEKKFGSKIASIVEILSKPPEKNYPNREERDMDYLHRVIYGTKTIRDRKILTAAQTIKIADRIHNLRTLDTGEKGFAKRIVDGTYEIFVHYFIGETEVPVEIKRALIGELIIRGAERNLLTPFQIDELEMLSKEIIDFKIPRLEEGGDPVGFIKELIPSIKYTHPSTPPVVAFSGMSGVGRTSFAKKLKRDLEHMGRKVVIFDANDYLVSREERDKTLAEAKGRRETYFEQREKHYDFLKFKAEIIDPLERFRNSTDIQCEFKQVDPYDRTEGTRTRGEKITTVDRDTVVIIEGIHILQKEFMPVYDATFMFFAPGEVCLKNVLARERHKLRTLKQSYKKIRDRFTFLDWPSYRKHWIEYWLSSGFVIDVTDYRNPKLKRNPFPRYPEKAPQIVEPKERLVKSLTEFFQKLYDGKFTAMRRASPESLASYWADQPEISISLNIAGLEEYTAELASYITELGLNLLPQQKIHIFIMSELGDRDKAKITFKKIYSRINLGTRDNKKARIKVTFGKGFIGEPIIVHKDFAEVYCYAEEQECRTLAKWLVRLDKRSQCLKQFLNLSIQIAGGELSYNTFRVGNVIYLGKGIIETFDAISMMGDCEDFFLYELYRLLVYEDNSTEYTASDIQEQFLKEIKALHEMGESISNDKNMRRLFGKDPKDIKGILYRGWAVVDVMRDRGDVPPFAIAGSPDINTIILENEHISRTAIARLVVEMDKRFSSIKDEVIKLLDRKITPKKSSIRVVGEYLRNIDFIESGSNGVRKLIASGALGSGHEKMRQKRAKGGLIKISEKFMIQVGNNEADVRFAFSEGAFQKNLYITNGWNDRKLFIRIADFYTSQEGARTARRLKLRHSGEEYFKAAEVLIGETEYDEKEEICVIKSGRGKTRLSLYTARTGKMMMPIRRNSDGQYILDLRQIRGNEAVDKFFEGSGAQKRTTDDPRGVDISA